MNSEDIDTFLNVRRKKGTACNSNNDYITHSNIFMTYFVIHIVMKFFESVM